MCAIRGKNTRNVILISEKSQAEKGNVIPKKTKIEQGKLQGSKQTSGLVGAGGCMNRQNTEVYQDSTMMDICHLQLFNSVQCTAACVSSPLTDCGIWVMVLYQCSLIYWKMQVMERAMHGGGKECRGNLTANFAVNKKQL